MIHVLRAGAWPPLVQRTRRARAAGAARSRPTALTTGEAPCRRRPPRPRIPRSATLRQTTRHDGAPRFFIQRVEHASSTVHTETTRSCIVQPDARREVRHAPCWRKTVISSREKHKRFRLHLRQATRARDPRHHYMLVEAHQGPSGVAPPRVPRRSCAEGAARAAPPCSTEFPIPDDATMLLEISVVLQQLCDQNSDLRAKCPTIFDSVAKPTMSVHCYLIRIRRYTKFDSLCFLVALAYLRRLCEHHGPSFCPTHHNIHRLFITAVLVASKANDGAPRRLPSPALAPRRPSRRSGRGSQLSLGLAGSDRARLPLLGWTGLAS